MNVFLIAPAKRVENHGSPWLVSGNPSVPVHAICPCVFLSVLSLWPNYVWVYPCFVVLFRCVFRKRLRSYMLMRCHRFRTFAFQCEFRPSWQVNVSVIVCILIDWVISLLPRGRFVRWSWQIHVVALIAQRPHLQYLTTNVSGITPAKRVENHGSPWLVSGKSSAPVHALLPQWCVPVRWLRMGTSTYW